MALAVLACAANGSDPVPPTGAAGIAAAVLLTGSALFVIVNEGIANWQALWFGALLVVLSVTFLRTHVVAWTRGPLRKQLYPRAQPAPN